MVGRSPQRAARCGHAWKPSWNERLQRAITIALPTGANWRQAWPEIAAAAWNDRVCLSANELFAAPHHDNSTDRYPKGRFFAYFTYSFSVAEVEIDVLTGEFAVLRMDVLYDAGRSSNPAIDIGQIEGGVVQGIGFVTTEEAIYDKHGRLTTDNIWSYKPPCTKTIPIDFRVALSPQDPIRSCAARGLASAGGTSHEISDGTLPVVGELSLFRHQTCRDGCTPRVDRSGRLVAT